MIEISDSTLMSNPVYALLLLVACCLLWNITRTLFERLTKAKDKENSAVVEQLKETNNILAEIKCEVRVSTNKISELDNDVKCIDKDIREIGVKVNEHDKTLVRYEEKIKNLKYNKEVQKNGNC